MKSTRTSIMIAYVKRIEVEKGVFENELTERTVKAEQERIYQRRKDQARAEGRVLSARFKVRSNVVADELEYVTWKGNRYKVNSVEELIDSHYVAIELGELM
ncbi:TPA: phage head-tail adapter protein [Streptococcus suis]